MSLYLYISLTRNSFNPTSVTWFSRCQRKLFTAILCYFCTVNGIYSLMAIPTTVGLRRRSTAARCFGFRVRNPPKERMSVLLRVLCVVRSLCDGLTTHPEESYRIWCVWMWEGASGTYRVPSSHDVSTEALRCKRSSAIINSGQNWLLL
jgi:hypothetical protein